MADLEKKYTSLQKKYKLPTFKELDTEFEISSLEKDDPVLRCVRRKMNEKVIFFCKIAEGILYPHEKSHLNAYESSFFGDEQKQEIQKIHRPLMVFERRSLKLDILCSEAEDAAFINELWSQWKTYKKAVFEIVQTMEKAWKSTPRQEKSDEQYFG